jgi:hypothetical protein
VVHVLVNLFGFPVLAQQAPENTHPAHPKDLGGEPGLPGTPPLTCREIRLAYIAGLEKTEISDMNSNGNEQSKWVLQQYTVARVPPLLFGLMCPPCTGPRMDLLWLLDDEAVLHQLTNVLAWKYCRKKVILMSLLLLSSKTSWRFQCSNRSKSIITLKIERAQKTEKTTTQVWVI